MDDARAPRVAVVRPYATLPSEGGVNDRYVNLCEALTALGASPEFFCSDFVHNSKQRRSEQAVALNATRLPYLRQIRSIAYRRNLSLTRVAHEVLFGCRAFWRILRGPRPDVVVVGEPLFFVGWLALFYGLVRGAPVIADVIDLWPEADIATSGALRKAAYRALALSRRARLRLYRAVCFVSRSYAQRLAPKDAKAAVFYWGSQLKPHGRREAAAGPVVALYAGSLGLGYDIETMLEAAAILRREGAPLRVVIAGDGPKRGNVLRAQEQGDIDYLGQLDRDQLAEAYERADIGLLPYQAGSVVAMPIKFFDCVNFGLYLVSSLTMEAADIIAEEAIGADYAPGDAGDLAARLRAAARDRGLLDMARAAGAELARDFSIEAQYGAFARFVLDQARASER
jgi:glycosyltransferase involved in cell wall biosynthesis